jgi:probable F420-dependent oxidoreductase
LKFTVEHPLGQPGCDPALYRKEGLSAFARAAEDAGFDAVAFTEHPAPSLEWLQAVGHESVDPLAALAFVAGVTSRVRLLTYLLVLPYRNPLLTAKMIATVDQLSDGRLTVGACGGYLRSEFFALGVDFEERGALLDEAIDVIRELWSGESLTIDGRHFTARSQVSTPGPVQQPHPPIWIGGNGKNARRRVARAADGWAPIILNEEMATTTRMPAIPTLADLAEAIDELRAMLTDAGRDPASVRIQVQAREGDVLVHRKSSWAEHQDWLGQLAEVGVTDVLIRTTGSSVAAAVEQLHEYAREGIEASRK